MTDCKRNGNRWSTTEILNLQREYELLNLSVQEIAQKHQRSVNSILFKLHAEGITDSLYEANGYTATATANATTATISKKRTIVDEDEDDIDSSSDYEEEEEEDEEQDNISEFSEKDDSVHVECDLDTLSERVWSLETSVGEINTMVKQMFDKMTMEQKSKKSTFKKSGAKLTFH